MKTKQTSNRGKTRHKCRWDKKNYNSVTLRVTAAWF